MPAPRPISADELQDLGGHQALGSDIVKALRKPIAGAPEVALAFLGGSAAPYVGYPSALAGTVGAVGGLKGGDYLQKVIHEGSGGLADRLRYGNSGKRLQVPARVLEYLTRPGAGGVMGKGILAALGFGAGLTVVPPSKEVGVMITESRPK